MSAQNTLLRQWHMLRLLPRAAGKITVQQLQKRLESAEFAVTERTIQRDLMELSKVFPLVSDERNKPFGWSWQKGAPNFDLPGLSLQEALTLTLVEQHLRNQLPPSTLDTLQPYFESAARTLTSVQAEGHTNAWLDKVRNVPPVQPLLPPAMNDVCRRTVYEALMLDRQLTLTYQKRGAPGPTVYPNVHPLAIVQRGQLIYLVGLFADYDDARLLAMHRIVSADMLYEASRRAAGFSIDDYIGSGAMGFRNGDEITLVAVFSRKSGEHLYETPICASQVLENLPGGYMQLTAKVPDTQELLWWLLGLGDGVQVISPAPLRKKMKDTIRKMALGYE